jgi:hypothetical protein
VTIVDASVETGTANIIFSSTNGAELTLQNLFVFNITAEILVQSDNTGGIDLSSTTIELADISGSNITVSCDVVLVLLIWLIVTGFNPAHLPFTEHCFGYECSCDDHGHDCWQHG